jgi:hypothetical protein
VTYAQRLQDFYSACLMFWIRTHTFFWTDMIADTIKKPLLSWLCGELNLQELQRFDKVSHLFNF